MALTIFRFLNNLVWNNVLGPNAIQHLEPGIYWTSIGRLYYGIDYFIPVSQTSWDGTTAYLMK